MYDPDEEDDMDRKAQELAMKMAAMRSDIGVSHSDQLLTKLSFIRFLGLETPSRNRVASCSSTDAS